MFYNFLEAAVPLILIVVSIIATLLMAFTIGMLILYKKGMFEPR